MRALLYVSSALAVMALAFWAYGENYETRRVLRDVEELRRDIGLMREALSVQKAEWAYLNRPERLRALADLNFERLQLMPMSSEHFGDVEQIAYPTPVPPHIGAHAMPEYEGRS